MVLNERGERGMGHFPWRSAATKSDVPSSSSAMCVPYPGEIQLPLVGPC